MIKTHLQHDAFLADVKQACTQKDTLHLWWLGQSGYLVQWNEQHLLLDPYLSDSLTKKYADTPKPHVRMTELVIDPARLDFIDVVTSSHNHTDHLDGETLIPLMAVNQAITVIVPEANRDFVAERLHTSPERLCGAVCGQPITVGDFRFTSIPAAHEELETDDNGHHRFIGFVVEVGPWTLYHSGDTMLYADEIHGGLAQNILAACGNKRHIDVAMLPINGRDPRRGVAGNLSGPEAVALAQQIEAGVVFPCHYEMFEFNTVSPEEFVAAAENAEQTYHLLRNGEGWHGIT